MSAGFDAIVIGAGPAGSTAAILLADAGWHVALVEKQAYPRRKVCGECISATNLPILEALGVDGLRQDALGGHRRMFGTSSATREREARNHRGTAAQAQEHASVDSSHRSILAPHDAPSRSRRPARATIIAAFDSRCFIR